MHVHCHVAWGHVTTLGVFEFAIVCRITLKVSPNCINLLCFGSFAGAGAHHQGLRRLKPCQFQRTVYWHCECDKLCSNARFELLAVCCSWTRGRKANGPCLTRLQSAFVEVPSKVESAWTTFSARFKAGQRRCQKIANCLEVDFPAQRYAKFPRMQWGQILAACLLVCLADKKGANCLSPPPPCYLRWKQKKCFVMLML